MPNQVNNGTQVVPKNDTDSNNKSIRKLLLGKMNCTFFFQPFVNTTTSTIYHTSIGGGSTILLFPTTFEGAAVMEKICEDKTLRTAKSATFKHPSFPSTVTMQFLGLVIGS